MTSSARVSANTVFEKVSTQSFKPTLSVAEWQELGFEGSGALRRGLPAAVLKLAEKNHNTYWLTFRNFYVITRYNRSPRYAMAVYELSQEIIKGMDGS